MFATYPSSWLYLQRTGRLKAEITPYAPGAFTWFVLQNRPGAFFPRDHALIGQRRLEGRLLPFASERQRRGIEGVAERLGAYLAHQRVGR